MLLLKWLWSRFCLTLGRVNNYVSLLKLGIFLSHLSLVAEREGSLFLPDQLKHAEIKDMPGAKVPLDLFFTNQDGEKIPLAQYFNHKDDKRPVILSLGYYGCPMLCSLVLNGLVEGLNKINLSLGKDYRIISISIDEREDYKLAKQKQSNYLPLINDIKDEKSWQFHVADALSAKKLADAVGFDYFYDQKTDQFAHGAGVFVISPSGILSRTLYGISFKPQDIKLSLLEASEGKIGSFIDRVILSCFHYDPDSHKYGIYIMGVMRLGGLITVLLVTIFVLVHLKDDRKRI